MRAELGAGDSSGPVADVHVHIEPRAEELTPGTDIPAAEAAIYRRIQAICSGMAHTSGCQDVVLHGMKGKLYLSLHLLVDRDHPISEVHGIAEELESRLRIEFPQTRARGHPHGAFRKNHPHIVDPNDFRIADAGLGCRHRFLHCSCIRPKFMTVATTFVGLVPIMWSIGTGSDVMKRIAAPMVGGILTSFLLELLVYPAIYEIWKWHFEVKKQLSTAAP